MQGVESLSWNCSIVSISDLDNGAISYVTVYMNIIITPLNRLRLIYIGTSSSSLIDYDIC